MNRVRGGKYRGPIRIIIGLILGLYLYIFAPESSFIIKNFPGFFSILCLSIPLIMYIIGESWGWGKWIGGIIDKGAHPDYNDPEGTENGIHWITEPIFPQEKNYYNYCLFALMLRGIWWWFPIFIPFVIFNAMEGSIAGTSIILLGLTFPLSFVIARIVYEKFKLKGGGDFIWEIGEFIYGGFQGLFISTVLLFS